VRPIAFNVCGFLGVIWRDASRRTDVDRLVAARETLAHRGPDEAGRWLGDGAAFGHRRLKVLDLVHGQQPLADDRAVLVYNGEIYNHEAIRGELETDSGAGTRPMRSSGDTETLFHALGRFGLRPTLERCNGMFALGHWRASERRLDLARDRMGQKPLYWFADDEVFVFASEMKAILTFLDRRFDLDPLAIDQFLARGYVLSPRTIFRQIRKLPAGCVLELDANRWSWRVEPWWALSPPGIQGGEKAASSAAPKGASPPKASGGGNPVDALDELLADAVELRLLSDVPIGCLLSGGIDSSLITAYAGRARGEPIEAFSVGFDEPGAVNELPLAERVASHLGCRWRSRQDRQAGFLTGLEDTFAFFDEPYGNPTAISMRRLASVCREHLTVVLSGQGGDELTAGYPGRYNWACEGDPAAARASDDLCQYLDRTSFIPWANGWNRLLSPALQAVIREAGHPLETLGGFWDGRRDRLNRVLYADCRTNLPDYLVALEDRMTMACGLEGRNPLLDHRVVEFLMSLPAEWKVRNGRNKWILQELARRYVPAEVVDGPKRGFTPPLSRWITEHGDAIASRFASAPAGLQQWFSPEFGRYLKSGRLQPQHSMPIYYALVLVAWASRWGRYVRSWSPADFGGGPAGHGGGARRMDAEVEAAGMGEEAPAGSEPGLPRQAVTSITGDPSPTITRGGDGRGDSPLAHAQTDASQGSGSGDEPTDGPAQDRWQRAFRDREPRALAEARWFCQALKNLPDGATIELHGDEAGFFALLATSSGLHVAPSEEGELTPESTADTATTDGPTPPPASAAATYRVTIGEKPATDSSLWLRPFQTSDQLSVQAQLDALASAGRVAGAQAVPLDETAGLLIVRFHPSSPPTGSATPPEDSAAGPSTKPSEPSGNPPAGQSEESVAA